MTNMREADFTAGPLEVYVYEHTYEPNPQDPGAEGKGLFIAVDAIASNSRNQFETQPLKAKAAVLREQIRGALEKMGIPIAGQFQCDFHCDQTVLAITDASQKEAAMAAIRPLIEPFIQAEFPHAGRAEASGRPVKALA